MIHQIQNLSDQQSGLQGHGPVKEDHHHLKAMTDLILKDLLVFGSILLVVSVVLYFIFFF